MNPLHPRPTRAQALLNELFALERTGMFEQALRELENIWEDTTQAPNVDGLDARSAADVYLRCGALIGFLGHARQIPTAQERSKNLLTEARTLFLEIYQPQKIAECENYLALAYWRNGEINEAESWVEVALAHYISPTCDTRLYSHVIQNLIRLQQKRFKEICTSFADLEETFLEHADNFLTGNFYMNFGLAAKNLGDTAVALGALRESRDFFAKAGNRVQIAMAENNLAQLFKADGRFREAHEAIDHATEMFELVGDRTRVGFSLDSKALIYYDEGKYSAALKTVDRALVILGMGDNFGYLTETMLTKAKIQLFADGFSTATLTLVEAVELAKIRIGEETATNLIAEFERALERLRIEKAGDEKTSLAPGDLKLIVPASIAHYKDYQGVWINNPHLETYGLPPGSLAVVVPCEVRRGDLVALVELDSDLVSCGVYDSDFGIVCLEAEGSEPQLFDQSDVKVLGRIVGMCPAAAADGTMYVKALKL